MPKLNVTAAAMLPLAALAACQDDQPPVLEPADTMIGDVRNCRDPELILFDNMNRDRVFNGGAAPDFDTRTFDPHPGQPSGTNIRARRYCLIRIETYHWNGAKGAAPGKLGLIDDAGRQVPPGPWQAAGSAGQGGAPNVNWSAPAVTAAPGVVLIHGHYTVSDSAPGTWSWNARSGRAYARVVVKEYDEGP